MVGKYSHQWKKIPINFRIVLFSKTPFGSDFGDYRAGQQGETLEKPDLSRFLVMLVKMDRTSRRGHLHRHFICVWVRALRDH